MSDIAAQLRAECEEHCAEPRNLGHPKCTRCAAADIIEKDAAALRTADAALDVAHKALDNLITRLPQAQSRAERAEAERDALRQDAERLRGALSTLIGTCEIAAVMPEAIGKALVLQWDSPELEAARSAIDAAREGKS